MPFRISFDTLKNVGFLALLIAIFLFFPPLAAYGVWWLLAPTLLSQEFKILLSAGLACITIYVVLKRLLSRLLPRLLS